MKKTIIAILLSLLAITISAAGGQQTAANRAHWNPSNYDHSVVQLGSWEERTPGRAWLNHQVTFYHDGFAIDFTVNK